MLKINYDVLGIGASIACAIHCALLPLFLTSLPILGINIINNIFFEVMMILIALTIGLYSLLHGYKKHHHKIFPMVLFSVGMVILLLKQFFHQYQVWFLLPAVVMIISAHYINYRQCKLTAHCHTDHFSHD
jgi:hypothetical protein